MSNPTTPSTNGLARILGKLGTFVQLVIKNLKWIFLSIAFIAVLANISTCNQKNTWQDKYKTYYDSTQVVLKRTGDSLAVTRKALVQVDSLKTVGAHQKQHINSLNTALVTLGHNSQVLVDSLDKLTATAGPTNPQVCMLCQVTVRNLRIQIKADSDLIKSAAQLDVTRLTTISKLEGVVHTDTLSIIDLRRQLSDAPKPQGSPHLFWVIKVNPNQAFLIGVIGTVAAILSTGGKL